MRERVKKLLIWAAALGLAVLGGVRAVDLAAHGWTPRAAGEARWFPWAWGTPADRSLVPTPFRVDEGGLGVGSDPDTPLHVTDLPPGARPPWVQVMTQYALPGHPVTGAGPTPEVPGTVALDAGNPPLLTPRPAPLSTRLAELAALGLGLALALMLGWMLNPPHRAGPWRDPAVVPLLGLTAVALGAAVTGALGAPPTAFPAASALLVGAAWLARRRSRHRDGRDEAAGPETATSGSESTAPLLDRGLLALLFGLAGLFVARIAAAPLWSWDHFAIWGFKARRIALVGAGPDLFDGLGTAFASSNPGYPLGLPLAWVQLAPFAEPGGWLFRFTHVAFGALLALAVVPLARRLGASRPLARLAAAWVLVSPLLFDTENLGLAEPALALWLVAGVGWALRPDAPPWVAGVLLGFLPWIKPEGLPLAALAVGALWAAGPASWDRRLRLAIPAALLAAAARAHVAWVGGDGTSFFAGDFVARLTQRLGDPGAILAAMGRELAGARWLGLWFLFLVVWITVSTLRDRARTRPLLALGAMVAAQMVLYFAVYCATYLEPLEHVASSFGRIATVFGPLAAAAVAAGGEILLTRPDTE